MTSVNALGIRMIMIVVITAGVSFGTWKLVVLGFSHTPIEQPSASPQATVALLPSPAPVQSLSPELVKQMTEYASQKSKEVGPVTKKYVESLPKEQSKEQVLGESTIATYIDSNRGILLPELPAGTVKLSTASGKTAIKTYLDQISPAQNKKIQNITGDAIGTAFQNEQSGQDPKALTPILASITANFDLLKGIATPKEAEVLQTKLLQATQALITNIQVIQSFKQDPISGLIGLKNISALDAVYTDISAQISALEKKYNLQ